VVGDGMGWDACVGKGQGWMWSGARGLKRHGRFDWLGWGQGRNWAGFGSNVRGEDERLLSRCEQDELLTIIVDSTKPR
jgi:hypothetical protein